MNEEVLIFEVSEKSFNQSVIFNSNKLPVIVEFMGVWSEPCVLMSDNLSSLAHEFAGQFIFAKVDIDEQPELRKQYHIENVPTLAVFKDTEVVRTEVGQLQEDEIRALLKELGIFNESDDMREQARQKHVSGDTSAAILLLTQAIQKDPGNTRVAMDMVQIFIDIGQVDDARALFNKLPDRDKNSSMGKSLSGQLIFIDLASKTDGDSALIERLNQNAADHAARFDLSLCQVSQHQYREGLDNLLQLISQEPDFKQGAAREMFVTIVNMIGSTDLELAQEYRRKLSNLLAG